MWPLDRLEKMEHKIAIVHLKCANVLSLATVKGMTSAAQNEMTRCRWIAGLHNSPNARLLVLHINRNDLRSGGHYDGDIGLGSKRELPDGFHAFPSHGSGKA